MTISASKRRWIAALAAVIMVCMCAAASAQSFSLGDEADEIATIQTALKHLDLYTGEITGHFGSTTEAAVKKFQKRYALLDDGIVGEDTLKALYEAAGITSSGSTSSGSASSSSDNGANHLERNKRFNNIQYQLRNTRIKFLCKAIRYSLL